MWMKLSIGMLVAIMIVLSIWAVNLKPVTEKPTPATESTQIKDEVLATYKGMLPCGDCSGIETTLILYQDMESKQPTTYKMTSVYTSKNVDPLNETGKWVRQSGQGAYRSETVYKLTSDSGGEQTFIKNNDSLQLLGVDGSPLPAGIPSTLELVK